MASVAVKASSPDSGWPSAEVTRHCTVYVPAGSSPVMAWLTVESASTGSPVLTIRPSGACTAISAPIATAGWSNVSVTCAGTVATVDPSAGSVERSTLWALAGLAPSPVRTSTARTGARARRATRAATDGVRDMSTIITSDRLGTEPPFGPRRTRPRSAAGA